MTERRPMKAVGINGPREVVASIATEPPWTLTVDLGDGSVVEAEDEDLYEALRAIRLQLESSGLRLCCQGALANVFPSGMARQMAGGRRAYRLRSGRQPGRDDLVDIFDPAYCDQVLSVEEQQAELERLRGD